MLQSERKKQCRNKILKEIIIAPLREDSGIGYPEESKGEKNRRVEGYGWDVVAIKAGQINKWSIREKVNT